MASYITNFNQQAMDQQLFLLDRMRVACPNTAELGQNLTTKPLLGGFNDIEAAQRTQALTKILLASCSAEQLNAPFPAFVLP
ncbi:hypothetical protein JST97_32975 [bacterium]|nr:hypothetical protein [bacterium]